MTDYAEKDSIIPSPDVPLWKALLAEFVGTFILVFVGASAAAMIFANDNSFLTIGLAFGLALIALIYIFGGYCGANFNPAVSFGLAIAGRMNWGIMLAYWIVQLIAGIAAAALVVYFFGNPGATVGSLTYTNQWAAVLAEAVATFFLVIGVLFITRRPFFSLVSGIAIGVALAFGIIAIGALTGGSLNPARSLGPAIFSNNLSSYWIYAIGPLLGGLFAALVFKLLTYDYNCCEKVDECGNKILDECGNPIKECKRPVVDECGKVVENCDGIVYETYIKCG